VQFSTIQDAVTHLHSSVENIGASLVVFDDLGKPIMQIQISHISLSTPVQKPSVSLDYDAEQKSFAFRPAGEDGLRSFPSMKAAIAQLARHITTEVQLTICDAMGKPMFFATVGPDAGVAVDDTQ